MSSSKTSPTSTFESDAYEKLREIIDSSTGEVSVYAEIHKIDSDYQLRFDVSSDNGSNLYLAASLAKLAIALFLHEQLTVKDIRWPDVLTLRDHHKRPGTGILQAFPDGTRLTVRQAHDLILRESDNTATNVLLEKLGSQRQINRKLAAYGIQNTGLTDRTDTLFESGEMTAADACQIITELCAASMVSSDALRQSHYNAGLRRRIDYPGWWQRNRSRFFMTVARVLKAPGLKMFASFWLRWALKPGRRSTIACKEGILPRQNPQETYRHDVGVFCKRYAEGYIAVFTRNANPNVIGRIGAWFDQELNSINFP